MALRHYPKIMIFLAGFSFFPVVPAPAEILDTGVVRISVSANSFRLEFQNKLGEVFLSGLNRDFSDPRYQGMIFSPAPSSSEDAGYLYPGFAWEGRSQEESREWYGCRGGELDESAADDWVVSCPPEGPGQDGIKIRIKVVDLDIIRVEITPDSTRAVDRVSLAFNSDSEEHFFGLGERFNGVDQKGRTVYCWSEEGPVGLGLGPEVPPFPDGSGATYWPVPFFLSSRGYGMLLDTGYRTNFELTSVYPDAFRLETEGPGLKFYLFYGPDPQKIISDFTWMGGGKPPLPPRWVFAPWNDAVGGEREVRKVAETIRSNHIPSGVIWTEDWASPQGSYSVNEDFYPQLGQLIDDLHQDGFRFLTYYWPYLIEGTPEFNEGVQGQWVVKRPDGGPFVFPVMFRRVAEVDFTNISAVVWYQSLLKRGISLGFDGWMFDFGEYTPASASFSDGRSGREMHNRYPFFAQSVVRDILSSEHEDGDFAFFSRSGYLGSQGQVDIAWPGDQNTSWEAADGLPSVIPAGLSLGLSGVALFGPDIGGYHSVFSANTDRELFYRWVQVGALSPIMRTHHGWPGGNWSFDTDQETLELYREYARLHTRLFPYLYAYAARAHETGLPIMRHLFLQYPNDPEVFGLDYEYLLGEEILVAPVLSAGAREQRLYLPYGTWFDFWTDRSYAGPGWITVSAPLDRIPLLVRSGTIIPMLNPEVETLWSATGSWLQGNSDGELRVQVYLPESTNQIAGASFELADGTSISLDGRKGGWPVLPTKIESTHSQQIIPEEKTSLGFANSTPSWFYDRASQRLRIKIQAAKELLTSGPIGDDQVGLVISIAGEVQRLYEFSIFYPQPEAEGCAVSRPERTPAAYWWLPVILFLIIFGGSFLRSWVRKIRTRN
ncbi:MAG: glycoside hydrolase family 31 protein [bacterium]|nr:glycoside hydrolase family 31 protein [bacterium]